MIIKMYIFCADGNRGLGRNLRSLGNPFVSRSFAISGRGRCIWETSASLLLRSDGHQVTITQCGLVKSSICNSGHERRSGFWLDCEQVRRWFLTKNADFFWHLQAQLNFTEPHMGWLNFSVFFALATSPSEVIFCAKRGAPGNRFQPARSVTCGFDKVWQFDKGNAPTKIQGMVGWFS